MEYHEIEYWNRKNAEKKNGWDIGYPSIPLKEYIDQLTDKYLRILVPGAGNAWEVEYLYRNGFKNVYLLDFSEVVIKNFRERMPEFPEENIIQDDFFLLDGCYDLIFEQAFLTSFHPNRRSEYTKKMFQLLSDNGKLCGLYFNIPLNSDKPPFGGQWEEYVEMFKPYFSFKTFEICFNSIKPRRGNEIFAILQKL